MSETAFYGALVDAELRAVSADEQAIAYKRKVRAELKQLRRDLEDARELSDRYEQRAKQAEDWLAKTEAQSRETSILLNRVDEQRIKAEQREQALREALEQVRRIVSKQATANRPAAEYRDRLRATIDAALAATKAEP